MAVKSGERSGVHRSSRMIAWRHAAVAHRRMSRLDPVIRGLLWSASASLLFVVLNTLIRGLATALDPFQAQFLRYAFGLMAMLPLVFRGGIRSYMPHRIGGQFVRGAVHTFGLTIWFIALPHITIADTTAIGFTGPIFIMLGAAWFLGERMRWDRWIAALIGIGGVLIVVAPKLALDGGGYSLIMLASAPVFAASYLLTKGLTRYESPGVIVLWQSISVTLLSIPMALLSWRAPTLGQWVGFAIAGVLGSAGHYCLARSFSVADISATQSIKFLELVWATVLGWLVFSDTPSRYTLIGGVVICASTIWIARRERRGTVPV